jgi:hypothetical protein
VLAAATGASGPTKPSAETLGLASVDRPAAPTRSPTIGTANATRATTTIAIRSVLFILIITISI